MSTNDKNKEEKNNNYSNKDQLKNENLNNTVNEGNSVPNIHPTGKDREIVDNEEVLKGNVGGAPSQKSGSRGSADVQDGGEDVGSSAGSH
ncbi:hypothetical protein DXT99_02230 [Pontibacter diazotrophicus]|uniref:Uncharacterized protein n=1 Tax=Pontibacter diazotrophicus TaxID=1400979 RepID=A0A3D8LIB5_9BACT|nr:hypothetical protein [Pontibacter diazotrophicus]RDV16622.1 hypothetical protein DXT99_02230 [Pontibacter diazotrophicus]